MTAPFELLSLARRAADAAVEVVTSRPDALEVDTKSTATDLVTQMDRAAEATIRAVIAQERPHDRVVGEEMGDIGGAEPSATGAVTWWIDPIDGTTNYVYDHPGWNVSVAAEVDRRVVAGVVADPTHGRTYSAARGAGARVTDRRPPLRLGDPPPLDRALVATGFSYDPRRRHRQGLVVAELLPRVRDIRRVGAAALDLCSVAAGRVDAYFEVGLAPWDIAAGSLVAEEAGARVAAIDGGPLGNGTVLAAHPALFDELVPLLHELGAASV